MLFLYFFIKRVIDDGKTCRYNKCKYSQTPDQCIEGIAFYKRFESFSLYKFNRMIALMMVMKNDTLFDVRQSKRLFAVISGGDIPAKFIGYTMAYFFCESHWPIEYAMAGIYFYAWRPTLFISNIQIRCHSSSPSSKRSFG